MIVRRDGSVDFRILAARVGWYGSAFALAAAVGVLIALIGS